MIKLTSSSFSEGGDSYPASASFSLDVGNAEDYQLIFDALTLIISSANKLNEKNKEKVSV